MFTATSITVGVSRDAAMAVPPASRIGSALRGVSGTWRNVERYASGTSSCPSGEFGLNDTVALGIDVER